MRPDAIQIIAAVFFGLAVLNTFLVKQIYLIGNFFKRDSLPRNFFRMISQVEVVFGLWAMIFIVVYTFIKGFAHYDDSGNLIGGSAFFMENLNFREAAFVFVIMTVSSSRPVVMAAEFFIKQVGKFIYYTAAFTDYFFRKILHLIKLDKSIFGNWIPLRGEKEAFFFATLVIGPLLGSLITEPAAMTVTALILKEYFYDRKHMSKAFMYATLGLLFVNISIGGSLTAFAAPPILMAAEHLGWSSWFVFIHIGRKAVLSIILSTLTIILIFRKQLAGKFRRIEDEGREQPNMIVTIIHLIFLLLVIFLAKHTNFFIVVFIFFIGFTVISKLYQGKEGLHFKDSIQVAFFLGGIITLGSMQDWWLQILLQKMEGIYIYLGTAMLTAVTDNSALTYLGSLVDLPVESHLHLVAGALAGGGMTIIANAPNPAGYGILKSSFGTGADPIKIFVGAIIPTLITLLIFY